MTHLSELVRRINPKIPRLADAKRNGKMRVWVYFEMIKMFWNLS